MSELITLVEIDQPFCTRTYGSSPCTASVGVTGTAKCFNTFATCQDTSNYDEGTLTLRFGREQDNLTAYDPIIPSLRSASVTPLVINLAGMNRSVSPFGSRESASITFADHPYSDYLVDKYRTERPAGTAGTTYTPEDQGTFWGKWLKRNPYHEGYDARVIQGIKGQTVNEMETRNYLVDKISGPADGQVNITLKDVFVKVEDRKAKAPTASRGELRNGFNFEHGGDINLIPIGIGDLDYPSGTFWVAVNDECIKVTRSSGSDVLAIQARGELGTTADDHEGGDKVQRVLAYESQLSQDIIEDLLINFAGVPSAQIDTAAWDTAMTDRPERLTAYIAEPVPVEQLVGEIAEQIGFSIWPDTVANEIQLKVLESKTPAEIDVTVDDDAWMIEGSYSAARMNNERVSQVWVYYGKRNPLEGHTDPTNYHARRVYADLDAEGVNEYGERSIREIYSRWIPQFAGAFAGTAGSRLLSIFRDPPLKSSFNLHRTRDGELEIAEQFLLESRELQDDLGASEQLIMAPIELARNDGTIEVMAQQIRFAAPAPTDRTISIETDTSDVNLRTLYDALFGAPAAGDVVTVEVLTGVTVSSSDAAIPAMQTGAWVEGVEIVIDLQGTAQIVGAGGNGGADTGADGEDGGTALLLDYPATIIGNGTISGGGGGGGGASDTDGGALNVSAEGGGGAGIVVGTGFQDGTATLGGSGDYEQTSGQEDGARDLIVVADAGDGGNLGQPGQPGFALIDITGNSEGGRGGFAIDGGAIATVGENITTNGTVLIQEPTSVANAATITNLSLDSGVVLLASGEYSVKLAVSFDDPDDSRVIAYQVQYRMARDTTITWLELYQSLALRYEFETAEIGTFIVRARAVYPSGFFGPWAYAETTNLGTFTALAAIGLPDPIDPKLWITANLEQTQADIRIQAGYEVSDKVVPGNFLVMYSAATSPATLTLLRDDTTELVIDPSLTDTETFEITTTAGSTSTVINYTLPEGISVNTAGGWWVGVDGEYYKVNQATSTQLFLAPGYIIPTPPGAGETLDIIELDWADSRLAEFRLVWVNGEVIKHNGLKQDSPGGEVYLDVEERGAEGTTQAAHSPGDLIQYYPAPGPLTKIITLGAADFELIGNEYVYTGNVSLDIPPDMAWAAVTCAVVTKATNDLQSPYVRSNIVPLTFAGPV